MPKTRRRRHFWHWNLRLCGRNGERDELSPEKGPQEWAQKALDLADGLLGYWATWWFLRFLYNRSCLVSLIGLMMSHGSSWFHDRYRSMQWGCWLRTHVGQTPTIGVPAAWFACSNGRRPVRPSSWHSFVRRSAPVAPLQTAKSQAMLKCCMSCPGEGWNT